jgi:hypothetical protein
VAVGKNMRRRREEKGRNKRKEMLSPIAIKQSKIET